MPFDLNFLLKWTSVRTVRIKTLALYRNSRGQGASVGMRFQQISGWQSGLKRQDEWNKTENAAKRIYFRKAPGDRRALHSLGPWRKKLCAETQHTGWWMRFKRFCPQPTQPEMKSVGQQAPLSTQRPVKFPVSKFMTKTLTKTGIRRTCKTSSPTTSRSRKPYRKSPMVITTPPFSFLSPSLKELPSWSVWTTWHVAQHGCRFQTAIL